jgi:hypothetical protein
MLRGELDDLLPVEVELGRRADERGVGAGRRDGREGVVIVTVPDLSRT